MTDTPHRDGGDVVTYLDTSDPDNREFRRGVVAGIGVSDPDTDEVWVPITGPDKELTLVDPDLIVDSVPVGEMSPDQDSVSLAMFAGALTMLALDLDELDHTQPLALSRAQHLLARFARAIRPIEGTLAALVDARPSGTLSVVLTCIGAAADEFEAGNVTNGTLGILVANAAMAEITE